MCTNLYNDFITILILLQNQRTPLHIAVYRDNVSLVKMFISFGADINTSIVSCSHALHRVTT